MKLEVIRDGKSHIRQRFSIGGTRTPRGTSAVAKGYAGKKSVAKYCYTSAISYATTELFCVFHKITSNTSILTD